MPDIGELSPATTRRLRALRTRITLLISLLAIAIVAVFATLVIRADTNLRNEQIAAELFARTTEGTAQIEIEEGGTLAAGPDEVVDADLVFAIRPVLTVVGLLTQRGQLADLPAPTQADLQPFIEAEFEGSGADEQDFLLFGAGDFEPDERDAAYQAFLQNPATGVLEEAQEIWYGGVAEDLGISLVPDPVVYLAESSLLTAEQAESALTELNERGNDAVFRVDNTNSIVARGAVLRDVDGDRGVVMAVRDITDSDAAHNRFRLQVLAISAGLVALGTVTAWIIAGRTIDPAARALGQQERFLADAAHELRTPVAAIRTTAEAATGEGEDAINRIDRVATLAARASDLTDDLLTLARMDAERLELRRQPTRLDLLAEAVLDGDDRFELSTTQIVANIDPALMTRAIDNLIRNAVHHGGVCTDRPGSIEVAATGDIIVRDHGAGFEPGTEEAIFDRFRSSTASSGHGLGLTLSRWIAQTHGGNLTARNHPDGGAEFRLTIPAPN